MTATRSTPGMMHCSLNFSGANADLVGVNATAHASAAPVAGPKLDNRRVLAALVDLGIVVAGSFVILFAADALSGDTGEIRGALGAVILGWTLYYYFALESGDGQTVGKKLMKLRVVLADGRPAGMREIAVRTVLRVVDGIGFYIVGLIVMMVTGQRRQRVGDLAAGTIVVDASAMAQTRRPRPLRCRARRRSWTRSPSRTSQSSTRASPFPRAPRRPPRWRTWLRPRRPSRPRCARSTRRWWRTSPSRTTRARSRLSTSRSRSSRTSPSRTVRRSGPGRRGRARRPGRARSG